MGIPFIIILGTILLIVLGTFIVLFLLHYQKRKFVHQKQLFGLKESYRQTLLISQLEIQEQTLKNISQEIHDNIGQALSLAKLNLSTLRLSDAVAAEEKILITKELVSKVIQDLRNLSHSLNTDYVSTMGLPRAIEYDLEILGKSEIYKTEFSVAGEILKIDEQKELILFRIVQELINNIIKHAKASCISIKLEYGSSELVLTVTDNGEGFDLSPLDEKGAENFGLGIRNMHQRASLMGGTFQMTSTEGLGTTARISIPLNDLQSTEI